MYRKPKAYRKDEAAMTKTVYLLTGAAGHLGNTLLRLLQQRGETVRALLLEGETPPLPETETLRYFWGDVCRSETLKPLFDCDAEQTVVLHTAGIVDITGKDAELMARVNIEGTRNMTEIASERGVKRFVYVSSVHAIAEHDPYSVMQEADEFSPESVSGAYARTKAAATQIVLNAAAKGLNAVVVHPSGIIGPYDSGRNYMMQVIKNYLNGKLPACIRGGYDFVDVRDVAYGCLAAAQKGRNGQCYILSNRHYEIRDILFMLRSLCGGKRITMIPTWLAKAFVPLLQWIASIKKQRPVYTMYSLQALNSNDRFSHRKADDELDYHPRDLYETLQDTVAWLKLSSERRGMQKNGY